MQINNLKDVVDKGFEYHHTAWAKGYHSRKYPYYSIEPYEGKFGKGFKVHHSTTYSTQYHLIDYFVRPSDFSLACQNDMDKLHKRTLLMVEAYI